MEDHWFKNGSGFSLLEVLLATSILAGLSMAMMRLFDNSNTAQGLLRADHDQLALSRDLQAILSVSRHCRASLADPSGPVSFRGSSIRTTPITGIEVWRADQDGIRSRKIYAADGVTGKLRLSTLSLRMPDYTLGKDFDPGLNQTFEAELLVEGSRILSPKNTASTFKKIFIPLKLIFSTDSDGVSVVTDCRAFIAGADEEDTDKDFVIWY
jgi:prepilin-type N-terminal cleavage/methylation domain-containing protein